MLLWLYWLISNGLIFAGSPSLQDLGSGRKHQSSKLSFFTVASFAVTSRPKGVGCVFACSTASGKVQAQLYIEIFGMMSSEKINNKNLAWCDLKEKRMFPSWFKLWSSFWHSPMGGHSLSTLMIAVTCGDQWFLFGGPMGWKIDQDKFPGVANYQPFKFFKLTSLDHSHFCVTCTTITSLNKECLCFGGVAFH